jgi:hypothetical protein
MTSSAVLNWTGVLIPAAEELSDTEIKRRYGALLTSGVSAFRDDPQYLVEMAETAVQQRYNKRLKEAKAGIRREHPGMEPALVLSNAEEVLRSEGLVAPARPSKRRRAA